MNAAHLHITLVHVPVVIVPLGFILLAWAKKQHSLSVTKVALFIFILAALVVIPAFLLGEGAEELVEHLPGISKDLIGEHAEIAEIAFWTTLALGILSIISWGAIAIGATFAKFVVTIILILSLVTSGLLAYTAQAGGKIRHPEAFQDNKAAEHDHDD